MKTFFLLFILILLLPAVCLAFDNGDFHYWNTESVEWKAKPDWKVALEEEFRFGDNAGTLYYEHTDIGLTYYGMAGWFDIGVNYRQIFNIKKNHWRYENRPHISGTFKYKISGVTISDRNRFEYRNMEDAQDDWRYRNKLTLTLPKYTAADIQPYIADEIFYSFDKERLVKNRAYAGLTFKIIKKLKGEIFFLYETDKSGKKWVSFNTLGTKLKLVF